MAVLLYPLAKLQPPLAAALAWYYVKVVLALVSLFWVFRLIAPPERPFPAWAQGLAVVLSLRPILSDLQHGNVNIFILFLVVAALTAYRRGFDVLAGVVLALSVACKVTPALFLPYFLWKRAWKTLAGAAVGLALFLWPGFVPAGFIGWGENQHQLTSWYKEMVYPFVVEGKVWTEQNNQSLPGLAYRLLTDSASASHYDANVLVVDEKDNLLNLNPSTVQWLLKACTAMFGLAIVWCCRTPTRPRPPEKGDCPSSSKGQSPFSGGWRLSAEFALVVLGMLLFSERTWKHHCVTLMLPFSVLCYYLAACDPTPRLRNYLIGTLAAVTLLIESTSTSLVGMEFGKAAQTYGAFVWAHLLLVGALVVLLRQPVAVGGRGLSGPHSRTGISEPRPLALAQQEAGR